MGTVYLIHFERKFSHAGHYLGYTDDLDSRIECHRKGNGSKLLYWVNLEGIKWDVVRVWNGGKNLERSLKRLKNSPRLCPVCRA